MVELGRPFADVLGRLLGRVWLQIVAGFRYLAARRGHLTLVIMSGAINMCLVPASALLPLLVAGELGGTAMQLGGMSVSLGIGMLVGGVLLGVVGGTDRRILTVLSALIAMGLAVAALGSVPAGNMLAASGAMLMVGLIVPWVNGPIAAILQATVAEEYQGRVFTLMTSLAGAAAPVGLLLAASIAELAGVRVWYLAGGLVSAAMGVAGFMLPAVLKIEEPVAVEVADQT
jgi:DHA3 family macrolide efflux protein-like MFS transporter